MGGSRGRSKISSLLSRYIFLHQTLIWLTLQQPKLVTDPRRFTFGNLLIDSLTATLENVQKARDDIRIALPKFSSPPDPVTMPLASQRLVSFQNRQWIYTLLQNSWSTNMKTIMLRYQELHNQDGVVLWFCFLTHFAGTTTKNLIVTYSQLSETKHSPTFWIVFQNSQMQWDILLELSSKTKKNHLSSIF